MVGVINDERRRISLTTCRLGRRKLAHRPRHRDNDGRAGKARRGGIRRVTIMPPAQKRGDVEVGDGARARTRTTKSKSIICGGAKCCGGDQPA